MVVLVNVTVMPTLHQIIPNLILKMNKELKCAANLNQIRNLSLFIDEMANRSSDNFGPFVGPAAFAHKGGVHADAAAVKIAMNTSNPSLLVTHAQTVSGRK